MVCKFNHYTASISSVKMGIMVLLSAWIDQCSPMNKHKKPLALAILAVEISFHSVSIIRIRSKIKTINCSLIAMLHFSFLTP